MTEQAPQSRTNILPASCSKLLPVLCKFAVVMERGVKVSVSEKIPEIVENGVLLV